MNKEALTPLVIKAQAKDPQALNDLMNTCYETLYYYAYNEVKDYDLAADITQESCIEIMSTLESLRKPEAFLSWAGRIVTHKCSRHYRQVKNEVSLTEDEDGETILDRLPDNSRGSLPQQVQEDKEFKQLMWEMLDSLPPEQRQALLLYYVEDFSVGQIAEMQDVPAGTVKSRLNYGRKAVISKVDAYEKKTGTKLHSLAPLPLLLYFLFRENKAAVAKMATGALGKVWAGISAAGTATAGSAAVGGASAAAGAGLGVKIIAGVAAAAVTLASAAVVLPQILPEKPPAQAENAFSCEEYAGEWSCIIYNEETDTFSEEALVIYEEGILEFRGERYKLRPDSFEHYLFASPEDEPRPDSQWYTEEDRFSLRFVKHQNDYVAELQTFTLSGDGQILWESLGECIRLSGFEDYTPIRLTEENLARYLQVESTFSDVRKTPEEKDVWILYSRSYISAANQEGFFFCRFTPVIEYTLQEAIFGYDESTRQVSLTFETVHPETETLRVTLDPVMELLHSKIEVLYDYPGPLTPEQHPDGLKGMYITDAKLIGATDVYGFVFLRNE